MDNLFTPEVIEQFLHLLTTAADGGVKAVILWLALPTVAVLISAGAWVYGIAYAVKKVTGAYETHVNCAVTLKQLELDQPKKLCFKGIVISGDAEEELRALLEDLRSTAYVHCSDVRAARKVLRNERK